MGGAVPTGYVAINKKLKIKPEEGEMIKFMFESYLKHKSITAVCKLVKDRYGIEYRREMIKRLLKNPIYLGKVKHKNELYDGQHPAIIDQETFDKVAEIRASKDVAKRSCLYKKNEVGILRGILTCGCCHTRMTPTVSMGHGRRRYYYTSTKAKYYGYHTCHNGSVAVAILDEAIIQIITPMLKDAHILNGLIKQIAPDKTKELFKIMQHPEKVLAKMSELDKSLLVKELIENITVQCDNLEIKWTALALDDSNIEDIQSLVGMDTEHKIHRLLDFTSNPRNIHDPWYTGNFDESYWDIYEGCQAFLEYLKENS